MPISKKELDDMLEIKGDIEKITTISSDGRTFITRIPKDIIEELKLSKGNKLRWLVNSKEKIIKLSVAKEDGSTKKENN